MTVIRPTFSCFDDALEYLTAAAKADVAWAVEHLRLVHGLCLAPEGPNAGQPFAHAWVEQDRKVVIQAGVAEGVKGFYGCDRKEHYKLLRVQLTTVYTIKEAVSWNYATHHYGPWEHVYRELCSGSQKVFE